MLLPLNCPKPCWYAYMQWEGGGWKQPLPLQLVQFVQFIKKHAHGRAILGWGMSRGAKWLIELVREHAGLLDGAFMVAGYPQTKCRYQQAANARELIDTRNCAICMVHFDMDDCCGVSSFPHWHGEFNRHMADQHRQSSLISLYLPGSHRAANPIWMDWKVETDPLLHEQFEIMWQKLVTR